MYSLIVIEISIHALLAESDDRKSPHNAGGGLFLSTLSLRRATPKSLTRPCSGRYFYPRSPCGERLARLPVMPSAEDFYPRSPCGERQTEIWPVIAEITISIHALLAESDAVPARQPAEEPAISIHALLAESDSLRWSPRLRHRDFYPRSPCGERHSWPETCYRISDFYPRSPCGERPALHPLPA